MLTIKTINDAKSRLLKEWEEDGQKVIEACAEVNSLGMNASQFLDHCFACGRDWGGMLLSGLKELRPKIWELIPAKLGASGLESYYNICCVLMLCGVDISEG